MKINFHYMFYHFFSKIIGLFANLMFLISAFLFFSNQNIFFIIFCFFCFFLILFSEYIKIIEIINRDNIENIKSEYNKILVFEDEIAFNLLKLIKNPLFSLFFLFLFMNSPFFILFFIFLLNSIINAMVKGVVLFYKIFYLKKDLEKFI